MSYNDKAFYAGRDFHQNRLDALQKLIVGINHVRDAPHYWTDDMVKVELNRGALPIATKSVKS